MSQKNDLRGKIDLTGVDLIALAKLAYNLSQPMGLGVHQYFDGDLSDDQAKALVDRENGWKYFNHVALGLDYVNGRSVKLHVLRNESGQQWIHPYWYDHTDDELRQLLAALGVDASQIERARQERKEDLEASEAKNAAAGDTPA